MYHPDNCRRSYKPQTKHAERMLLPTSSQKNTRERTLSTRELRNRPPKKLDFIVIFFLLLSHTKLLTSIVYKLYKADIFIDLTHAQNNINFIIVCKLATVVVLATCSSAKF